MLNPWVIIGLLVFYATSMGGALYEGAALQRDKTEAGQKAAVDQAVSEAKADAAIDYSVQQEQALELQKHELLKTANNKKVAKAIQADPASTTCRMSDSTFSVLKSSISASNSGAPTSASDSAVPVSDGTGRQQLGGSELRTGLNRVDPLDVQTASPTTH